MLRAKYGQGSGKIIMDNVVCVGTETNLGQCTFNGFGNNNCGHNEDAGVRCQPSKFLNYHCHLFSLFIWQICAFPITWCF